MYSIICRIHVYFKLSLLSLFQHGRHPARPRSQPRWIHESQQQPSALSRWRWWRTLRGEHQRAGGLRARAERFRAESGRVHSRPRDLLQARVEHHRSDLHVHVLDPGAGHDDRHHEGRPAGRLALIKIDIFNFSK